MKSTKIFMLAALTLSVVACSNDKEVVNNDPVEAKVTANITSPESRAIDNKWTGDIIGVMAIGSNQTTSQMATLYKNVKYVPEANPTDPTKVAFEPATKAGAIYFQNFEEIVTFAAYAPYQASNAANELPGTNGKVAVNTVSNNTALLQQSIDFIYAAGATASRKYPEINFGVMNDQNDFSFHHMLARIDLTLQVSTDDGFDADQIFDAQNVVTLGGLVHEGTFDVTTGATALDANALALNWNITACNYKDDMTAKRRTYTLIVLPQDKTNDALPLTIKIDGQNYINSAAITPNLQAGYKYAYTITARKQGLTVSNCTITDWKVGTGGSGYADMEIPANP